MTDRPSFEAPIDRAAGVRPPTNEKAQRAAEVLATSPLARVAPGDRLYVREHWKTSIGNDGVPPRELDRDTSILMLADGAVPTRFNLPPWGKHRQGMHMPRWASRLTLIVEGVKVEPLQAISEADAIAEGVSRIGTEFGAGARPTSFDDGPNLYTVSVVGWSMNAPTAAGVYHMLWDCLHGAGAAGANPDVVALTFRVEHGNIDTLNLENARG
jgi:hypothetical protein